MTLLCRSLTDMGRRWEAMEAVSLAGSFADMKENSPYFGKVWQDYIAARNVRYSLKGGDTV